MKNIKKSKMFMRLCVAVIIVSVILVSTVLPTLAKYEKVIENSLNVKVEGLIKRVDENDNDDPNGDYVIFGSYPQSEVKDISLISNLNSLISYFPNTNVSEWIPYEYYIKNVRENFMWYKDVEYNNDKYRCVYLEEYRPNRTNILPDVGSRQPESGYSKNVAYWFKFEPLKWNIITQNFNSQNNFLLISQNVIDSQPFQDLISDDHYNDSGFAPSNTNANNYEWSSIRRWLNNDFYNTAFATDFEKSCLNKTIFSGDNLVDSVSLLTEEISRIYYSKLNPRTFSDYSKIQGLWVRTGQDFQWWLRTPDSGKLSVYINKSVSTSAVSTTKSVIFTDVGICPVIQIDTKLS